MQMGRDVRIIVRAPLGFSGKLNDVESPKEITAFDYILDHPKFAGIIAFLALAATFSPRLSTLASWICVSVAFFFGLLIVWNKGTFRSLSHGVLLAVLCTMMIAGSLVAYGWWLTEKSQPVSPEAMKSGPTPYANTVASNEAKFPHVGEASPALGVSVGMALAPPLSSSNSFGGVCSIPSVTCLGEPKIAGKILELPFSDENRATIAVEIRVYGGANAADEDVADPHVRISSVGDAVGLDYAGLREDPPHNNLEFTETYLFATSQLQHPYDFFVDITLKSGVERFPLTIEVWGSNMTRHTVRTEIRRAYVAIS